MQSLRRQRIIRTLKASWNKRHLKILELLHDYLRTRPLVIMPIGDIVEIPSVSKLIVGTPIAVEITREMLHQVLDAAKLEERGQLWIAKASERLLQLLKYANIKGDPTMADLCLAGLTFPCDGCRLDVSFPQVLFHNCCTNVSRQRSSQAGTIEEFSERTLLQAWSTETLNKPKQPIRCKSVIQACGLHPLTATAKDMDELDPLFEQPEIDAEEYQEAVRYKVPDCQKKRTIYSWRLAMVSKVSCHVSC